MAKIGLTLGPLFFNWPPARLEAFYADIAENSVFDRVHVGEVVCGKRMPFSDRVWPGVIEKLAANGKEVVLSTLAMPSTKRERKCVAELCEAGMVEVNDVTALAFTGGQRFVAGPFLNTYNEETAAFLAVRGAATICLPVELPLSSAAAIAAACPDVEIEYFAFGRLPLALSGRCYHARIHGLHKDACQFVCEKDEDGLAVETIDGQDFLAVNGIQTLSHGVQAFCPGREELAASGIRRLRISPHMADMVKTGRIYRSLLDGAITAGEARTDLAALNLPGELVDGYARSGAGCRPAA